MVQSKYPTAFPLKHQQKVVTFIVLLVCHQSLLHLTSFIWQDLRLALSLAESVSQPTPIAAATNELYKVAKLHGLSDHDFSAVIEALKAKLQTQT